MTVAVAENTSASIARPPSNKDATSSMGGDENFADELRAFAKNHPLSSSGAANEGPSDKRSHYANMETIFSAFAKSKYDIDDASARAILAHCVSESEKTQASGQCASCSQGATSGAPCPECDEMRERQGISLFGSSVTTSPHDSIEVTKPTTEEVLPVVGVAETTVAEVPLSSTLTEAAVLPQTASSDIAVAPTPVRASWGENASEAHLLASYGARAWEKVGMKTNSRSTPIGKIDCSIVKVIKTAMDEKNIETALEYDRLHLRIPARPATLQGPDDIVNLQQIAKGILAISTHAGGDMAPSAKEAKKTLRPPAQQVINILHDNYDNEREYLTSPRSSADRQLLSSASLREPSTPVPINYFPSTSENTAFSAKKMASMNNYENAINQDRVDDERRTDRRRLRNQGYASGTALASSTANSTISAHASRPYVTPAIPATPYAAPSAPADASPSAPLPDPVPSAPPQHDAPPPYAATPAPPSYDDAIATTYPVVPSAPPQDYPEVPSHNPGTATRRHAQRQ